MRLATALCLACLLLRAKAQAPIGGDCHNGQGRCVDTSRCANKNWISNLCQGGNNIKCCMKKSIDAGGGGGSYQAPASGTFTSDYGPRSCSGCSKFHRGIDIGAPTGTRVNAVAAGAVTVRATGCKVGNKDCGGGFGNWVTIKHSNGDLTAYAHLSAISVASGKSVSAGTKIGEIGNTGSSTGAHLHFEVWKGGDSNNRVDPCKNGLKCPEVGGKF